MTEMIDPKVYVLFNVILAVLLEKFIVIKNNRCNAFKEEFRWSFTYSYSS